VTKNYALPGDVCLSFLALYEQLADFEQDLHRHVHLENNVLFPGRWHWGLKVIAAA